MFSDSIHDVSIKVEMSKQATNQIKPKNLNKKQPKT